MLDTVAYFSSFDLIFFDVSFLYRYCSFIYYDSAGQTLVVKVSYSCMKNVGSIIKSRNARVNKKKQPAQRKECNCRKKGDCPLNGKCLTSAIIYKATVQESNGNKSHYIGLTGVNSRTDIETTPNLSDTRSTLKKLSCLNMYGN